LGANERPQKLDGRKKYGPAGGPAQFYLWAPRRGEGGRGGGEGGAGEGGGAERRDRGWKGLAVRAESIKKRALQKLINSFSLKTPGGLRGTRGPARGPGGGTRCRPPPRQRGPQPRDTGGGKEKKKKRRGGEKRGGGGGAKGRVRTAGGREIQGIGCRVNFVGPRVFFFFVCGEGLCAQKNPPPPPPPKKKKKPKGDLFKIREKTPRPRGGGRWAPGGGGGNRVAKTKKGAVGGKG